MIENEKQLEITKKQAALFQETLKTFDSRPHEVNIHPTIRNAEKTALQGQLAELREQIADYYVHIVRSIKQEMKLASVTDIKIREEHKNYTNTLTDAILDVVRTRVQTMGGTIFVNQDLECCSEYDALELIACIDMGITEVKTFEMCV